MFIFLSSCFYNHSITNIPTCQEKIFNNFTETENFVFIYHFLYITFLFLNATALIEQQLRNKVFKDSNKLTIPEMTLFQNQYF
jgi:hypothetical protein